MLKRVRGDLHIHTCLSPCADDGMTPAAIVREARRKQVGLVGICDHNSMENVEAVMRAGERENVGVLGGMEITSKEEVHILAVCDGLAPLGNMQKTLYEHLEGENDESRFGPQDIVNEFDEKTGSNSRLLIGATDLGIQNVVELIRSAGGLAIASHIDREGFSIMSQLGFIPESLRLDGLEVSPLTTVEAARRRFPDIGKYPLLRSSDAHSLGDIGRQTTTFLVADMSFAEIRKALAGEDGRRIEYQA
ncbi:MAG: PHP domain-containing protein [Elusimicrobia bacterium]|nr:PHP domain-containing protein [Elusimicrobiota bacterium]